MFREDGAERSCALAKEFEAFAKGAGLPFLDAALYGEAADEDGIHMDPASHERLGKAMAGKVREILK